MKNSGAINVSIRKTHLLALTVLIFVFTASAAINIRDPMVNVHGVLDMNNNPVKNVAAPNDPKDAASKNYVDAAGSGGGATVIWGQSSCPGSGTKLYSGSPQLYYSAGINDHDPTGGGDLVCKKSQINNVIFQDGFEDGNLNGWSTNLPACAGITAVDTNKFNGKYGVKLIEPGINNRKIVRTVDLSGHQDKDLFLNIQRAEHLEVDFYDGSTWHEFSSSLSSSKGFDIPVTWIDSGGNNKIRIQGDRGTDCSGPAFVDDVSITAGSKSSEPKTFGSDATSRAMKADDGAGSCAVCLY